MTSNGGQATRARWIGAALALALAVGMAPAAAVSRSADKAIANAGTVTLRDFPAGWTTKPRTPSSSKLTAKLVSTIPVCRPFIPLIGNAKTGVRAQPRTDFTNSAVTVSNNVTVYPRLANAAAPFNAVKTPAFADCFQQVLTKAVRTDLSSHGRSSTAPNVTIAVVASNPGITVGDDQAALSATATLTAGAVSLTLYIDIVAIRVGRAIDSFDYENDTRPITDVLPAVITASVGRLTTALGH